jgi:hypothetical protein
MQDWNANKPTQTEQFGLQIRWVNGASKKKTAQTDELIDDDLVRLPYTNQFPTIESFWPSNTTQIWLEILLSALNLGKSLNTKARCQKFVIIKNGPYLRGRKSSEHIKHKSCQ